MVEKINNPEYLTEKEILEKIEYLKNSITFSYPNDVNRKKRIKVLESYLNK